MIIYYDIDAVINLMFKLYDSWQCSLRINARGGLWKKSNLDRTLTPTHSVKKKKKTTEVHVANSSHSQWIWNNIEVTGTHLPVFSSSGQSEEVEMMLFDGAGPKRKTT